MRLETINDIMNRISFTRERTRLSYLAVCRAMGIPHRTYRRWQWRRENGQPFLRVPGPAKTGRFDPVVLSGELASLSHGTHRTAGMGRIYSKYCECLSRREITCLAAEVRREQNEAYRRSLYRIEWLVPGMVWAVDGTTYSRYPEKRDVLAVRDLCSKYQFRPMVTAWTPCCEEVGGHVAKLLSGNDAPLFFKMDNAGNLTGPENMNVLAENRIIPLISPPVYPQYNGSVEKYQGDIKDALRESLPLSENVSLREFDLHAALVAHDLNHRARACLQGKNPCQVFNDQTRKTRFTIRERMAVYDWINQSQEGILKEVQCVSKQSQAWARRKAIKAWLIKNNFIKIYLIGVNVTQFSD
jgi:hypothetical protein